MFGLTETLYKFLQLNFPTTFSKDDSLALLLGSIKKVEKSHIYIFEIKALPFLLKVFL